jgi:hypothetical protein
LKLAERLYEHFVALGAGIPLGGVDSVGLRSFDFQLVF